MGMHLASLEVAGDRRRSQTDVMNELLALAQTAGIEVRLEPFELKMVGKGGLCRIGGRPVILVDEKLGPLDRIGVVGMALGRAIPEKSALRASVDDALLPYLRTGHSRIRPLVRPKPLARAR